MTGGLLNVMRREAERAVGRVTPPQVGVVTSYDPAHYACKVRLQPSGAETGWLPVTALWAGNGWGFFCPPTPGDVVDVHFQEGGREAGFVNQRFFSAVTRPLPVPSGESWQVHRSGSCLKFLNDGTVEVAAATQINSAAPLWRHTGDLVVTGDIYDRDTLDGTLGGLRDAYNLHHHTQVEPGAGTSGLTDHPV